ncbi:hypothetical protein WICMUC_001524 [Wickerhamomyces mucosus]|uniref:SART-1 protein n=1 Tax=Wickerhamomyces mucosus TaxID=1378264 RepID=A0A9P8PVS2_9ASCO|nr:hypothetical protein WICMUC_001524 [Wickerhamomyces mucosus]
MSNKEESISIEETNKIRISLGLKPIPILNAEKNQESTSSVQNESISLSETNKLRISLGLKPIVEDTSIKSQDITTEEYQKQKESQTKNEKLKEQLENSRSKVANRCKINISKSLIDEIESDSKDPNGLDDWLSNVGKKTSTDKKKIKVGKLKPSTINDPDTDLTGVKVSHNIEDFQTIPGDNIVLTFKDQSIYDDNDELESELLINKKKLETDLANRLNDKHFDRFGQEKSRIEEYEDRLKTNDNDNGFIIEGHTVFQTDNVENAEQTEDNSAVKRKIQFSLESDNEDNENDEMNDYVEVKPIKMKKLKKKSSSKRKRDIEVDEDNDIVIRNVQLNDQDFDLQDDYDLQRRLNAHRNKKLKKFKTPEELAKEIKEDEMEDIEETRYTGGLIYDENTEFLSSIKTTIEEEEKALNKSNISEYETSKKANDNSIEIEEIQNPENTTALDSPEQEKEQQDENDNSSINFSGGLGSTLSFLKSRNVIVEKSEAQRQQELKNIQLKKELELQKIKVDIERRILEEELNNDPELQKLPKAEREQIIKDELDNLKDIQPTTKFTNEYNPDVKISYIDEYGREMDQKEAYKQLSHSFHGKALNKSKIEKKKKRVQEEMEKRAKEESIL